MLDITTCPYSFTMVMVVNHEERDLTLLLRKGHKVYMEILVHVEHQEDQGIVEKLE